MTHNLFPGPNAAYNNPTINSDYYTPRIAKISAITPQTDFSTLFETVEANQLVPGQLVRFLVPAIYGMNEINETQAYVTTTTSATQFYADINTLNFTPFVPSASTTIFAFVNPIGDINTGPINTSGRNNNILYINGSFRDISPQ